MQAVSGTAFHGRKETGEEEKEMLWHRKEDGMACASFDKAGKRPVIRASICTGERVAGFQDLRTGQVEELMLIAPGAQGEKDLERFAREYQVSREEIGTIW